MTKEEMIQQINNTFDALFITKPQTKQDVIDDINKRFDKLLININD
ncbi:MAG: hypothetical protein ACLRFE_02900 [Clostridia bacterium]